LKVLSHGVICSAAYDRNSSVGRLDKGLDKAQQKKWSVANMEKDWKVIYPFELSNN